MTAQTIDMAASPGLAAWLGDRGVALAFTSYQAGKLIALGCGPDGRLTATDCGLERCMGLGTGKHRLWAASAHQLWRFDDILEPGQLHDGHDAVFLPTRAVLTGAVDIHDISERADGAPVFVVPRFNCLATLAEAHSFEVLWRPPFISGIVAEDRCHLNGLAMMEGVPRFVTALAATDESGGWREHKRDGGVLMDVTSAEIVATGLSMPHSPRLHQGDLWLHQSGTGEFGRVDLDRGRFEAVATLPGLPRGLAFLDRWAVVGVSKPRSESGFGDLPLGERLDRCGEAPRCAILVIDLMSGRIEHAVDIGPDVDEIYDVALLEGTRTPRLVDPGSDEAKYFIRPRVDG
jgi:uncharacterized protein (TIGR03032 family)